MIDLQWEDIDEWHKRAKVPGGWLVKAYEDVSHMHPNDVTRSGYDFRIAMCFVPDPCHNTCALR